MQNAIVEQEQIAQNTQTQIEVSRAVQEVQAAVLVAQKMPRSEIRAREKILQAAKRNTLAEKAIYSYPKGKDAEGKRLIVKGPSIRAAETLAKYWGNISFGIKELSQNPKTHTSEVLAYAWDLETNVREEKVFQVSHIRISKGNKIILTDPRDVYEKVANDGARRLRACILGILPSDIVEDFITECEKTRLGDNSVPLIEKIRNMVKLFDSQGVSQDMLEKYLDCKVENITTKQLLDLGTIYQTIKDGVMTPKDYFETKTKKESEPAQNVLDLEVKNSEVKDEVNK